MKTLLPFPRPPLLALLPLLTLLAAAPLRAQGTPTPTPTPTPASSPAPAPSPTATPEPAPVEEGAEAKARSAALELAGAFSNDGYKIRDGYHFGTLEAGKPVFLAVNLFAGNEYWFCAAGIAPARQLVVRVYGEDGLPVEQQSYAEGPNAAAGVVAAVSGRYLVKISLAEGEKSAFCFLYCYK